MKGLNVRWRIFLFLVLISFAVLAYKGVAAEAKELPAPQLVTDAWMLIIGYEADPEAIKAILPPGLEPNPSNMIVMNMYTVPEASQTSGFGAYTLTYLTVQLKDQNSYIIGSDTGEPGRYFAFYYNSSPVMRDFASKVGIPAEEGSTTQTKENGKLKSVLTVGGQELIEATADVSEELQPPAGGHLNYFGLLKDDSGTGQVMKYPIPFVVRTVKTENPTVTFNVPESHPLNRIKPTKVVWASYMKGSFVYPQAETLKLEVAAGDNAAVEDTAADDTTAGETAAEKWDMDSIIARIKTWIAWVKSLLPQQPPAENT